MQLKLFYQGVEYRKGMIEDFYFHGIQSFPKHLEIDALIYYNGSGKHKDKHNRIICDTIIDKTIEDLIK